MFDSISKRIPHISKLVMQAVFLSFALFGIVLTQYYTDTRNIQTTTSLNIIPAQVIKFSDLGLDSAASALMWIYATQQGFYYHQQLPDMIENTVELDPSFSYPYAFAALVLPNIGFPDKGIAIAKQGLLNADQDWHIPYYLATAYHIFFKDRKNAAFYFEIASKIPNAPENIKLTASRYGIQQNAVEQTKTIWQSIYDTSTDDVVREQAKNYIVHIEMAQLLEQAILIYYQKYGAYPTTLEDLVSAKIIKEIPVSPLGVKFGIDYNRITVY